MTELLLHDLRSGPHELEHEVGPPAIVLGKTLGAVELMPRDPRLPSAFQTNGWGGLLVDMAFNKGTQVGGDAFSNVQFGALGEWSFAFLPDVEEPVPAQRRVTPNHYQHSKSITRILEFSPVLMGANPTTLTIAAKGSRIQRRPSPVETRYLAVAT